MHLDRQLPGACRIEIRDDYHRKRPDQFPGGPFPLSSAVISPSGYSYSLNRFALIGCSYQIKFVETFADIAHIQPSAFI